jgi:hypothetical protein
MDVLLVEPGKVKDLGDLKSQSVPGKEEEQ